MAYINNNADIQQRKIEGAEIGVIIRSREKVNEERRLRECQVIALRQNRRIRTKLRDWVSDKLLDIHEKINA